MKSIVQHVMRSECKISYNKDQVNCLRKHHPSLENLITLRRRHHEKPANYMNLWQKLVGSTKTNLIFQEQNLCKGGLSKMEG